MRMTYYLLPIAFFLVLLLLPVAIVKGATFTDTFDTYSLGELEGVAPDWFGFTNEAYVVNSISNSSPNSVENRESAGGVDYRWTPNETIIGGTEAIVTFDVYVDSATTMLAATVLQFGFTGTNDTNGSKNIQLRTNGEIWNNNVSSPVFLTNYPRDEWFEIGVHQRVNGSITEQRVRFNGEWSDWLDISLNPSHTLNQVDVQFHVDGYLTTYIDNANLYTEGDEPLIEPTTEFNEVVDYIYSPDLNNAFGTSTVGAHFSIPEPTWIDSIGVDVIDPLGDVVLNITSSADDVALYGLFDDYYFDTTGAYEILAYFVQDGNRINNPTSLLFTVNSPEWVFDPVTGNLVLQSTTTIATSTLDAFNVDCPTGFIIGDLCKFAVGFFIPNASSIQALQASFNGMMAKAPFSFFTQSKTILDAFRTSEVSAGGSFSLTLYGENVPIVSTTTAASVGLNSDIIDFFKSIMIVALWLMLAWYLYWRIASIFGV